MDKEKLTAAALECGAANAAVIAVPDIPFRREFRAACEQNTCGKFSKCWMCPPDVGDIDKLIEDAKTYRQALVFQSVGQLEDSFDIEGMSRCAIEHNKIIQALSDKLLPVLDNPVILGAGACHVCESCTKLQDEPCRHPGRAVAPMEAYGIAVSELAALCGMKYINGQNTVTYFGGFLFR